MIKKTLFSLIIFICCVSVGFCLVTKDKPIHLAPAEKYTPGRFLTDTKAPLSEEENYIQAVKDAGRNYTQVVYTYNDIRYPLFEKTENLGNNLVSTYINNHYGLISDQGKIIVSAKYDYKILNVINNFYLVTKDDKLGIIDKDSNIILTIKYESINPIDSENIIVKENTNYSILNYNFQPKFSQTNFQKIIPVSKNTFIGQTDNLYSVFDFTGKEQTPKYTNIEQKSNFLLCRSKDYNHVYSLAGELIFNSENIGKITTVTETGFEIRSSDRKYGYALASGKLIFKTIYKEVFPIHNFKKAYIIGILSGKSDIYCVDDGSVRTLDFEVDVLNRKHLDVVFDDFSIRDFSIRDFSIRD